MVPILVSATFTYIPVWEAASLDEWLYNGGTYQVIVFHFFIGACSYLSCEAISAKPIKLKRRANPIVCKTNPPSIYREIGIFYQTICHNLNTGLMELHVKLYEGFKLPNLFDLINIKTSDGYYSLAIVYKLVYKMLMDCTFLVGSAKYFYKIFVVYGTGLCYWLLDIVVLVSQRFLHKRIFRLKSWWNKQWIG